MDELSLKHADGVNQNGVMRIEARRPVETSDCGGPSSALGGLHAAREYHEQRSKEERGSEFNTYQ